MGGEGVGRGEAVGNAVGVVGVDLGSGTVWDYVAEGVDEGQGGAVAVG